MEKAEGSEQTTDVQSPEQEMDTLRKQLEQERAEREKQSALAQDYLDTARRVQAEFENYKKRTVREREELVRCANERVLINLLLIYDDFERALRSSCTPEEFRTGVLKIHDNLVAFLKENGVTEIPSGGKFDPACHEALAVGEGEEGQIVEVYQKGYYLGAKVLRTSKVKVAKSKGENNG